MTADVDFTNHFWGDKHVGLSVLHNNAKANLQSSKELIEFLKERCAAEDERNKSINKTVKTVSVIAANVDHNATPFWGLAKQAFDRVIENSASNLNIMTEKLKEAQSYADELNRLTRDLKNKQTNDAVNLMQTTTTCLQKAKETYWARCQELEKLRSGNDSTAITKAENRKTRAADEYKHYVTKQIKVAEDFEIKMRAVATQYQDHEYKFLTKIQSVIGSFAQTQENSAMQELQVYSELREAIERTDVLAILHKFCINKGTGTNPPMAATFEEPDLNTAHSVNANEKPSNRRRTTNSDDNAPQPLSLPLGVSTTNVTPVASNVVTMTSATPIADLISLSPDAPSTEPPPIARLPATTQHELDFLVQQPSPSTSNSTQENKELATPMPDSTKLSFSSLLGIGKTKKDKARRTETQNSDHRSDSASIDLPPAPLVDEEGYSIKPVEERTPSHRTHSNSDSSFSDDDDHGITSKIKKTNWNTMTKKANVENSDPNALQDAASKISLGAGNSDSQWNLTTWINSGIMRQPLQASLTGQPAMRTPIRPSLTGGTARARPRASGFAGTSTSALGAGGRTTRAMSHKESECTLSRADSLASLADDSAWGGTLRPALSMSSLQAGEQLPIAMAIHETQHAWFSVDLGETKCRVRVFASVFVSFPARALSLIADLNALQFSLTSSERVISLIPNKQVLDASAVSHFQPCSHHDFAFDIKLLTSYLAKEREKKPAALFYNIEVLRYEVKSCQPYLEMQAFWKCLNTQTDIRIDYALGNSEHTLLNVAFKTKVDAHVATVHSRPEAHWSKETNTLAWMMTELCPTEKDQAQGSLKARAILSKGPAAKPEPLHAEFTVQDATISGCSVSIPTDSAYRLSLLRRKIQSGKYYADAQER